MPISSDLIDSFRRVGVELLEQARIFESLEVEGVEWVPVEGFSPSVVAGVDSSRQHETYRGFIVYAVQGYSLSMAPDGGLIAGVGGADAGYLSVVEASRVGVRVARDALVSSVSKTLEVKLLSRVAEGSGARVALLDGSYESFLGPILVFSGELRKAVPELAGRIRGLWEERVKLLDRLAGFTRLAFISKSSSKSTLVERGGVTVRLKESEVRVSDFIVVKRVIDSVKPRTAGFIWYPNPYQELRKGGDEVGRVASRLGRWYTLTYILLHPAGRPYQLTIPGKLSKEEVAWVVETLKPLSPDGYPRPLSVAHHLSTLKRSEFRKLASMILPHLETGREELERTVE